MKPVSNWDQVITALSCSPTFVGASSSPLSSPIVIKNTTTDHAGLRLYSKALLTFAYLWVCVSSVYSMTSVQFQIFYSVIRNVMVNMMNDLLFSEKSPNRLFHHKSMLGNITLLTRVGVARLMNIPVARSFYSTDKNRRLSTDKTFGITGVRTKLINMTRGLSLKLVVTCFTNILHVNIISKCKGCVNVPSS